MNSILCSLSTVVTCGKSGKTVSPEADSEGDFPIYYPVSSFSSSLASWLRPCVKWLQMDSLCLLAVLLLCFTLRLVSMGAYRLYWFTLLCSNHTDISNSRGSGYIPTEITSTVSLSVHINVHINPHSQPGIVQLDIRGIAMSHFWNSKSFQFLPDWSKAPQRTALFLWANAVHRLLEDMDVSTNHFDQSRRWFTH